MRPAILFTLPLALLLAATPAASRDLDQDEALRLRHEGLILPLESLLRQAMERHPGARLLEAELEEDLDWNLARPELALPLRDPKVN